MSDGIGGGLALRPRWRGRVHALAFLVAVPAGLLLVARAGAAAGRVGAAVFVVTLAGVFGTSAVYHLGRTRIPLPFLRRADHSMIYLLIAGTYTPVCLAALPRSTGIPLLVVIWAAAAVGVGCKLVGGPRLMRASSALYLVMGWVAVLALPSLLRSLSGAAMALLLAGGVVYSVGSLILYRRRPDPRPAVFGYHEVWHALTVVAGAAHFGMVWLVVSA